MSTFSNSATNLILIRHGETAWNRELRFQGQIDVPLNDMGLEQARRLGERMKGEVVHQIVCSDLTRTQQTSAPAAAQLRLPVHLTPTLREQSFGIAEGLRAQEIQEQYPEAWQTWLQFRADGAMPGGESTRQFHARVMAALSSIATQYTGQTVLVVTHGGVLDMVWRTVRGLGLDGPRQSDIPNAGLNRLRLADPAKPQNVEILDWADTAHLQGLGPQPVYEQRRFTSPDEGEAAQGSGR